jgi:arylsulfatase A-like enzyme
VHPDHGTIGPVPYRRTGGHTGGYGFATLRGPGFSPSDNGLRSAYDVVPTLIDLLGEEPIGGLSGTTLLGGPKRAA